MNPSTTFERSWSDACLLGLVSHSVSLASGSVSQSIDRLRPTIASLRHECFYLDPLTVESLVWETVWSEVLSSRNLWKTRSSLPNLLPAIRSLTTNPCAAPLNTLELSLVAYFLIPWSVLLRSPRVFRFRWTSEEFRMLAPSSSFGHLNICQSLPVPHRSRS